MHLARTGFAIFLIGYLVLTVVGCNSAGSTPGTEMGTGTAVLSSSSLTFAMMGKIRVLPKDEVQDHSPEPAIEDSRARYCS